MMHGQQNVKVSELVAQGRLLPSWVGRNALFSIAA